MRQSDTKAFGNKFQEVGFVAAQAMPENADVDPLGIVLEGATGGEGTSTSGARKSSALTT
eukprot:6458134-Amphidinium_carterae.1